MRNGSYLVLQRMSQDVPAFNAGVAAIATSTGLTPDLAGAKLVGRYPSGCPMETVASVGVDASASDPSGANPELLDAQHDNDFDYQTADGDGHIVPRAAHIRKAYPRDQDPPTDAESEKHRVMRRGIAFGTSLVPEPNPVYGGGALPDNIDRGLLFACYQASIANQFEFILKNWVNAPGFPVDGDGVDPILHAAPGGSIVFPGPQPSTAQLTPWVTMRGGGYFFAPGLKGLAALTALPAPAPAAT